MKKLMWLLAASCSILFLAGCGQDVDENKTPAQIQSEVANMSAQDIQTMIVKYQKAIEAKAVELKAEADKLARIPLTEQLGDEAKKLRNDMENITVSLDKLKANMAAYADGLKAKK